MVWLRMSTYSNYYFRSVLLCTVTRAYLLIIAVLRPTVYTCPTWKRRDCRAHLAALQTSPHFDSCVCDSTHDDASICLNIQKTIFLHACVLQEGNWTINPHI